jgi:hypothetical protein
LIDVFKVGVRIGMSTNSAQVLSVMLAQLTGVHIAAGKVSGALGTIRTAAAAAGAAFVGWEVGKGIWHAIEGNRELNKELEKTKQLGGDFAAHLGQTRAAAFQTATDVPTSVVADNVRLARELGTTIGKPDAAVEMLPYASKAAHVISHFTGEAEEDIIKNLIRTADARAQIYTVGADGKEHVDVKKLVAELEAASKGLILGAQFIKSNDMLQLARQASTVAKAQSAESFYADGVEAGIAMGMSKEGTALTGLMQQFVGGTMTKKVAEHLTEAGLLKAEDWHSGKSGGVVVKPAAARRFSPMMENPVDWLTTGEGGTAVKAYAAKEGISNIAAILQLFGRQTVQRLVSEIMSNGPQFARAREIYGNIPSVTAQYDELQAHDLGTNIQSVAAAWKSFMEAFSDAGAPLVIPILHGLTEAIHALMNGAANYPLITEGLIGLTAGIAGLTALGGSLVLLNLCWAPLATGLALLIGVPGIATAGVAIGSGMSAIAGGLTALALFFTGPLGAALLALYIFKPSSTNEGEENTPGYKDRFGNKDPNVSPYIAPAPAKPEKQSLILNLDGKKFASIMLDHAADRFSRASSGTQGADLRISPLMPGMSGAYG